MLEVLIALAIVGIGMLAVIGTGGANARSNAQLRDDTLADWVAMNELSTLRLAPAVPDIGSTEGDADMGGDPSNPERWHWKATVSATEDPDLLRIDIDVSSARAPKDVVKSITGFIGKPGPPAGAPTGAGGPPSVAGGATTAQVCT